MTQTEVTATAAVLLGLSAGQLADVLAPAAAGVCGWLDGNCRELALDADWLCARHRAAMPHTSKASAEEDAWYRRKAHEDDDHASCLGDCAAIAAEIQAVA